MKGNNKFFLYFLLGVVCALMTGFHSSIVVAASNVAFSHPNSERNIGSIVAEYHGEPVKIGDHYNIADVTVTAYYTDDLTKSEGFSVTPIFGNTLILKKGPNEFTLTYFDLHTHTSFSSKITVSGLLASDGIVSASYSGDWVMVGESYDLSKVSVAMIHADGSKEIISDFTVNRNTITEIGDNSFIATFQRAGMTYNSTFVVPGFKPISELITVYTGDPVLVGKEYSTSDVTAIAFFEDDITHSNGFPVTPKFGNRKIRSEGENSFTLSYQDPHTGNVLASSIVVKGYFQPGISTKNDSSNAPVNDFDSTTGKNGSSNVSKDLDSSKQNTEQSSPILSIQANYHGPDISLGNHCSKDDIIVEAIHTDGTTTQLKDYHINSTLVGSVGVNHFLITYEDAQNQPHTATLTVNGIVGTGSPSFDQTKQQDETPTLTPTGDVDSPQNMPVKTGDSFLLWFTLLGTLFGSSCIIMLLFHHLQLIHRKASKSKEEIRYYAS